MKFITFVIILIIGFIIIRVSGVRSISPEKIKDFILSFGWKSPILYIIIYTIRPLFFFPASILSLAGGLAFGPVFGTLYDIIGSSLGAYLSFFLSRELGMEMVQKLIGDKFKKLDCKVEGTAFKSMLFFRLIPIAPFDVISYAAGLSKIEFKHYALGTLLGVIPGAFVYNFMGNSLNNIFSKQFFLATLFMAVLMIIPILYKKLSK